MESFQKMEGRWYKSLSLKLIKVGLAKHSEKELENCKDYYFGSETCRRPKLKCDSQDWHLGKYLGQKDPNPNLCQKEVTLVTSLYRLVEKAIKKNVLRIALPDIDIIPNEKNYKERVDEFNGG